MCTSQDVRIKNRIRKLLSIAEDSEFEGEVQSALLKARQLMAEHDLNENDVTDAKSRGDVVVEEIYVGARQVLWKSLLCKVIAENFRCMSYNTTIRLRYNKNHVYVVIMGRYDDVQIAKQAYKKAENGAEKLARGIHKIFKRLTDPSVTWKSAKNSFFLGFVKGLNEKFEEQDRQHQEWGLVLVRDDEVDAKYNSIPMRTQKTRIQRPDEQCFDIGKKLGRKFDVAKTETLEV